MSALVEGKEYDSIAQFKIAITSTSICIFKVHVKEIKTNVS